MQIHIVYSIGAYMSGVVYIQEVMCILRGGKMNIYTGYSYMYVCGLRFIYIYIYDK